MQLIAGIYVAADHAARSALSPQVGAPTPFLTTDLAAVEQRYDALCAAVPGLSVFYATKSNPDPEILRTLAARSASFEIASIGELRQLQAIGVEPAEVFYSNPVKPPSHIARAWAAGVWRFAFDGPGEAAKIAQQAPGAAVYVRLRVDDAGSIVPLSRKFGASIDDAYRLMEQARRLGLRPYGLTFHVGSQCTDPGAWRPAIAAAATLMDRLSSDGIQLRMLDIGGGFPAHYTSPVPDIVTIGRSINEALTLLPYRPQLLAAEPGRILVAEAGVLTTQVIGREPRRDGQWLFLDVGAYHGLGEVLPTPGGWRYPIRAGRGHSSDMAPFTLNGPSCDPTDTFAAGVLLPSDLGVGDRLLLGTAGAYTISYATHFNAFPPPTQHFTRGQGDVAG